MIKVIGIPFDSNSSFLKGPAYAPTRIGLMEYEGSSNAYSEMGKEIIKGKSYEDLGNIAFNGANSADAFTIIKQSIAAQLLQPFKIFCYGGDHSVSYPVIDAFSEKYTNLHVLHLDAHADLYENFYNNPYSHASPFARLLEKGKIKSLTQVGIRTLNRHQRDQANKYGVNIVEMRKFNSDFLKTLQSPLYVSLDIDVLDPAFAPGVSHHEPGGLSTRELITIIQNIEVEIVGADLVEYNPIRDINNMTAMVCYKLFKELIDKMSK
ncbi:MAG: Arginase/agmatinase/formiminoglutamase family protein [Ferruginibacter sp.]|nr:Arginase/agmatinase/formiminoglutamase family protein [Ferruginibacter sp.]